MPHMRASGLSVGIPAAGDGRDSTDEGRVFKTARDDRGCE